MKKRFTKFSGLILGILFGTFFYMPLLTNAAVDTQFNGNPRVYTGNTGSRYSASGRFSSIQQLGLEIIRFIETTIVPFIMALALMAFLWGIFQYIRKADDSKAREESREFMLWGIVGLAVMVSVWGLVRILTNTIGSPLGIPSLNPIK